MESTEAAQRWEQWAVRGAEGALARVLTVLDANLPAGWSRLTGNDVPPFQATDSQQAWYSLAATPSRPRVTLSLRQLGKYELRGGTVQIDFLSHPISSGEAGSVAESVWEQIVRFQDEGIFPAAREVGMTVRTPGPEEVFVSGLPWEVPDRLRTFSGTARKSLPLTRQEAGLWNEFVIAAFRMKAVIDSDTFASWLMADGWTSESARELTSRLVDECLLLSRYLEEVWAA
jgi:hypothetical protein